MNRRRNGAFLIYWRREKLALIAENSTKKRENP